MHIWSSWQDMNQAAEREAVAALDMLESLHVQSMLNRNGVTGGDPAIQTVTAAMENFSALDHDLKLWLFMAPKVIAFQTENGKGEIQAPADEIDQMVIARGASITKVDRNVFRLSRPVILGSGRAADPRCASCHTALMGIKSGEILGGYSASVDINSQVLDWRRDVLQQIFGSFILVAAMITAVYLLLRSVALKPLERLAVITEQLSVGNLDVNIHFSERKDALGSMARSLQAFRQSLNEKIRVEAEKEKANARISYMAQHDALTGLANRAMFTRRLSEELADALPASRKIAVACLDVDHFKTVNDTLGHAAGDVALQIVADRLRSTIGSKGIASRYGGDEFTVLFYESTDTAAACADIINTFAKTVELEGQTFTLTVSIGVATAPVDGETVQQLMQNADAALYRSKAEGRNTYRFFRKEMNEALLHRRTMENDLRKAVADGELELHYQPLMDVASNRISGVEALIRWNHSEKGWISPADFIPIAETSGLIIPLGRWVIQQACEQVSFWPDLTVAVNVSPSQFADEGLIDFVKETLRKTGVAGERLEIEVTEGLLLDDQYRPIDKLLALKSLGIKIAMDDFGTGYSSLGYLQKFPFDKIKIDQSFVSRISEDKNAVSIVRSVIGLGRSLNITITAEGVETAEQSLFLREEGCDQMQGYYIARPQSALSISLLMDNRDISLSDGGAGAASGGGG